MRTFGARGEAGRSDQRLGARRRGARLTAAVLASATILLVPVGPAQAAAQVTATPADPGPVNVGQTNVPIALVITNQSTGSEAALTFTVDSLKLAPSCAAFSATNCTTADPGVFATSATGTGRAGTVCAAQIFAIGPPDASGVSTVTLPTPIVLGPPGSGQDTCIIDFTVNVLKMPTIDSRLDLAGVQTYMAAFIHVQSGALSFSNGSARSITVNKDAPTITSTASPGVRQGGSVFDTANLSGATNPTGTLTFALYAPTDATCAGTPVFTSPVPVNGNGSYQSATHIPVATGTYRWVVTYSGDANNASVATACNDPAEQVVVRPGVPGDYDLDRDTEIGVYRPSTGTWFLRGGETVTFGVPDDIPLPADYDGNGRTDVAVYRPSTGAWFVRNGVSLIWGAPGDIPVPADYDGNGRADITVYRPSTGTWYNSNGTMVIWGAPDDIPVPGDYNGDFKADIAVYRPSTGIWYIRDVDNVAWGIPGDIPVPADYDGDGDTDIAVYRPSTGTWYVRNGVTAVWGAAGDVPVPGDYDGDGDADIAVYRPTTGTWFVLNQAPVVWGTTGDIPLPLPYAIRRVVPPPG